MNQAGKAILPEIGLEQFGFVKDAGTQNAILVLVTIAKRMIQVQKPLFVCFIDYSKAYDKVHHDKLFDIVQELGIDRKNLRFLRNLYWIKLQVFESETKSNNTQKSKEEYDKTMSSPLIYFTFIAKLNDTDTKGYY